MTVILIVDNKNKVLARISSDDEMVIEVVEKGIPIQQPVKKGEMRTLIIRTSYW